MKQAMKQTMKQAIIRSAAATSSPSSHGQHAVANCSTCHDTQRAQSMVPDGGLESTAPPLDSTAQTQVEPTAATQISQMKVSGGA